MSGLTIATGMLAILFSGLAGCAGPREQACSEYDQAKRNVETTLSFANQLKIEGKLLSQELIKVDQDAGLYSKRLRDLCVFLQEQRISYQEYDSGVTKANEDYRTIREFLSSVQKRS